MVPGRRTSVQRCVLIKSPRSLRGSERVLRLCEVKMIAARNNGHEPFEGGSRRRAYRRVRGGANLSERLVEHVRKVLYISAKASCSMCP